MRSPSTRPSLPAFGAILVLLGACTGSIDSDAPSSSSAGGVAGGSTSASSSNGGAGGSTSASSGSGGSGGGCAAPAVACAGQCVDTQSDAANCGSCGHDCLGTSCAAGLCEPVVLAAGPYQVEVAPFSLVVDATHVYWGNDTSVAKVPIDGGTPVTLVEHEFNVWGIAVDATYVYWTYSGYQMQSAQIMKVALDGGTPIALTDTPNVQVFPVGIAVNATGVYWTDNSLDTSVMAVPVDGGTPTTLVAGSGGQPMGDISVIAVDAKNVYWTTASEVKKVAIGGGAPVVLATSPDGIGALAVDATSVYYATGSKIMKVAIDGGTPVTLASVQGYGAWGIAVDATDVYWTGRSFNSGHDTVVKVGIDGGVPVVVASDLDSVTTVAVDATNVYFGVLNSGYGDGAIMKVAK